MRLPVVCIMLEHQPKSGTETSPALPIRNTYTYSECVYIKVEAADPALLLVQEWRSAGHLSSKTGM